MTESPTPEEVRQSRIFLHLTQSEAAEAFGVGLRTWQHYEAGTRKMRPAVWRLVKRAVGWRLTHEQN